MAKDGSTSETTTEEISVDFEFFNMDQPDYHVVRQFVSHAFGSNTKGLETGELADLITDSLAEYVGTTVKTEGQHSDAYGFIALVPLAWDHPATASLKTFFQKSCPRDLLPSIRNILAEQRAAVVFMERLMNLPAEVSIPLYSQLLDDHRQAVKEDSRFDCQTVFMITPTFTEVESQLSPKKRKTAQPPGDRTNFYYAEVEFLEALHKWSFRATPPDSTADSRRAFGDLGIEPSRLVLVAPMDRFKKFVKSVGKSIKPRK